MSIKVDREHFAFLKSYWEQIKLLPSKKQKCEIFKAILSVQFFEKEINSISFSSQNQMILWEGLKPILKQSQKGYIDKMGLQSQNPKQGGSKAPIEHKDKDKDKDFEREGDNINKNIFFHLSENQKLKELGRYLDYLIEQEEYIKNHGAFKRKIKNQINKNDKFQLEDFEKWYLEKECKFYNDKYVGKSIGDNHISNIYPYFNTESYDPKNKFIVWLETNEQSKGFSMCFNSKNDLEEFLSEVEYATI